MKIITMGSIITVFSHKGGVGKTTLVHNLGYILADRGKRVLLVDADPQMNLTSAVAGFTDSVTYGEDGSEPWLEFLSTYPNLSSFILFFRLFYYPCKARFLLFASGRWFI